jgi:hypothetical protein
MTVSQQQLFLDLAALSEEQIEVGLDAGLWGEPIRPTVERYLGQIRFERLEAAASKQLEVARLATDAARKATNEATASNLRATTALMVAGGAMAAAMASAIIAFLALRACSG